MIKILLNKAERGSAIILMLMFLVLVMLEITILGAIVSRGMGEEGILGSQNIAAQQANQTAVRRLSDDLRDYLLAGGDPANVTTDFAETTGANALVDQNLAAVDPETGTSAAGNVTINAWVAERRNVYYHIITRSTIGQVSLVQHQWVKMSPCTTGGGSSGDGLSVLASDVAYSRPGYSTRYDNVAFAVQPSDGKVFYTGGSYNWLWDETTGISRLFYRDTSSSYDSHLHDASSSRTFMPYSVWHNSTGLSNLFGNANGWDVQDFTNGSQDVYNGRYAVGASFYGNDMYFITWEPTDGTSVLISNIDDAGFTTTQVTNSRVFFASDDQERAYTWSKTDGLSTLVSNFPYIDFYSGTGSGLIAYKAGDRVYFGGGSSGDTPFYTWHKSTGLSVLASDTGMGLLSQNAVDQNTGRVFFAGRDSFSDMNTWEVSTGLSILGDACYPGESVIFDQTNSRLYWYSCNSNGKMSTWKLGSGTSIIISGIPGSDSAGQEAIATDPINDRVFFGTWTNASNSKFYTWKDGVGISVLMSGHAELGTATSTQVNPVSGRVFFSTPDTASSNGYAWSWLEADGVSVIVSGVNRPGYFAVEPDESTGGFVFGQRNTPWNLWRWDPGSSGSSSVCDLGY